MTANRVWGRLGVGCSCNVVEAVLGRGFARVAFQFKDWRGLWPSHDVERDGLMREAADFEIEVTGVEGVAERWRRLRRAATAEHSLIPRFAGEAVGFLAGGGGSLSRGPDGRAEDALA